MKIKDHLSGITQETLKKYFEYSPETGILTRRISTGGQRVGSIAGCCDKITKYVSISFKGKIYSIHRFAWLYMTGRWPKEEIDHINGVRNDNRWCNLREATRSQNNSNAALRKDNTSGFKNVAWVKERGGWISYINKDKKRTVLGFFSTPEEAFLAYEKAVKSIHGEFNCLHRINALMDRLDKETPR